MQKRQARIVERVQALGYVSIEELATDFKVMPQTIRRDINQLNKEGLVRRYHGGAGLSLSIVPAHTIWIGFFRNGKACEWFDITHVLADTTKH